MSITYDNEEKKQKYSPGEEDKEEGKDEGIDEPYRTELLSVMEYCLGEEGCFIGMHCCIRRGIEEEKLVSSEEAIIPVRLRVLLQVLVREIGDSRYRSNLTSENKETGEGVPTDLY